MRKERQKGNEKGKGNREKASGRNRESDEVHALGA
jgi:hypothetical protein